MKTTFADRYIGPYQGRHRVSAIVSFTIRLVGTAFMMLHGLTALQMGTGIEHFYRHRANNVQFYPIQAIASPLLFASNICLVVIAVRFWKRKRVLPLFVLFILLNACGFAAIEYGVRGNTMAYSTVWKYIFGS
jgi:hypothetical protein